MTQANSRRHVWRVSLLQPLAYWRPSLFNTPSASCVKRVNISSTPLPDFLKGAIPFATVGAAQRLSKTGRAAGVGAIMPVQNAPNWVIGARYLNIDYSNAQVSPIDTMKTENYVGIFVERKFGAGGSGLLGF